MKKRTKKQELQRRKNFALALKRISFDHIDFSKIGKRKVKNVK